MPRSIVELPFGKEVRLKVAFSCPQRQSGNSGRDAPSGWRIPRAGNEHVLDLIQTTAELMHDQG